MAVAYTIDLGPVQLQGTGRLTDLLSEAGVSIEGRTIFVNGNRIVDGEWASTHIDATDEIRVVDKNDAGS